MLHAAAAALKIHVHLFSLRLFAVGALSEYFAKASVGSEAKVLCFSAVSACKLEGKVETR